MTADIRHLGVAAAKRVLRVRPVGDLARAVAAVRGRSLVLVYHRVDDAERPRGIVPSVPAELFRRQVQTLGELGEIVTIDEVLAGGAHARPRFALTFDDDFRTHAETVLPTLRSAGVAGAFFLSGRSLHDLGPYWFERLDALVAREGEGPAARRLGADARDGQALAIACENDAGLRRGLETVEPDVSAELLSENEIARLADAGMTVGFHTLDHAVLTRVGDDELCDAVTRGRAELERAAGAKTRHFAYPHGKCDARVASVVAGAGFSAAWTGRPTSLDRRSDRFRLGRWEPGALDVDDLVMSLAVRLTVRG